MFRKPWRLRDIVISLLRLTSVTNIAMRYATTDETRTTAATNSPRLLAASRPASVGKPVGIRLF